MWRNANLSTNHPRGQTQMESTPTSNGKSFNFFKVRNIAQNLKNNTTMKYFVIRVKTYSMLSPDYTVTDVINNEEDAVALAGILQRRDNDEDIKYIVTSEICTATLIQPVAVG